jgi:hypothetical protein
MNTKKANSLEGAELNAILSIKMALILHLDTQRRIMMTMTSKMMIIMTMMIV